MACLCLISSQAHLQQTVWRHSVLGYQKDLYLNVPHYSMAAFCSTQHHCQLSHSSSSSSSTTINISRPASDDWLHCASPFKHAPCLRDSFTDVLQVCMAQYPCIMVVTHPQCAMKMCRHCTASMHDTRAAAVRHVSHWANNYHITICYEEQRQLALHGVIAKTQVAWVCTEGATQS